jgi:hypothetical protein
MKILLLLFSFSMCVIARAALPYGSEFDARYWSTLDEKAKTVFLTGFCLGADGMVGPRRPQIGVSIFPEDIPKLIPLMDSFYKVHSGPNMLVRSAVEICAMQLRGKPEAEIDEAIRQAQKPWK